MIEMSLSDFFKILEKRTSTFFIVDHNKKIILAVGNIY